MTIRARRKIPTFSGTLQTATPTLPPGRSTRRISRRAVTGEATNISPNWQSTTSNASSGRESDSAGIAANVTLFTPAAFAVSSTYGTHSGTRSVASTDPEGPTRFAASAATIPGPVATSSTCALTRWRNHRHQSLRERYVKWSGTTRVALCPRRPLGALSLPDRNLLAALCTHRLAYSVVVLALIEPVT